ncbi:MAG: DUF3791 domain-containing protein [Clostridiales Family XIII bacterium]|nr:DUF3791 domain-containing protein [Clostridiales Family XIII bacterium]
MNNVITYQDVQLSTLAKFILSVALLYKSASGYTAREVAALFRRYGVYDFLEEFKDIEMMLPEDELLSDVSQVIVANGGHFHADLPR